MVQFNRSGLNLISGFSHEERLAIKQDIASNIVSAIQTLLNVSRQPLHRKRQTDDLINTTQL